MRIERVANFWMTQMCLLSLECRGKDEEKSRSVSRVLYDQLIVDSHSSGTPIAGSL